MKKPIFKSTTTVLALCLAIFQVSAQDVGIPCLSKGNFAIGSELGFSTAQSDIEVTGDGANLEESGTMATQLNLSPNIGYFFGNNFVLGLGMDYLLTRTEDDGSTASMDESSSDSRVLFGPYLRYYFPIGNDQAFFLSGVTGFGASRSDVTVGGQSQEITNNITTFGFGPGFAIFSDRCLSLEAQVRYNYGLSKNEIDVAGLTQTTETKTNAFDFSIGVHYYFTRTR